MVSEIIRNGLFIRTDTSEPLLYALIETDADVLSKESDGRLDGTRDERLKGGRADSRIWCLDARRLVEHDGNHARRHGGSDRLEADACCLVTDATSRLRDE